MKEGLSLISKNIRISTLESNHNSKEISDFNKRKRGARMVLGVNGIS